MMRCSTFRNCKLWASHSSTEGRSWEIWCGYSFLGWIFIIGKPVAFDWLSLCFVTRDLDWLLKYTCGCQSATRGLTLVTASSLPLRGPFQVDSSLVLNFIASVLSFNLKLSTLHISRLTCHVLVIFSGPLSFAQNILSLEFTWGEK